MKLRHKIIFSVSVFIFCLTITDLVLSKIYFKNEKSYYRLNFEKNISTNCYTLDNLTGYKPIWGKCRFPNLFDSKSKNLKNEIQTEKIIILGDSNSEWSDYGSILEKKLNSGVKTDKYEVINMGTAGYNTHQEVNLFFREGIFLQPKLIILQFSSNDFKFTPVVLRSGNNFLLMDAKGYITKPNQFLIKNSSIYKFYLLHNLNIQNEKKSFSVNVSLVKNSLADLAEYANKKDIPLIVVTYPLFNKNADLSSLKIISKILDSLNINQLDLANNQEYKKNPEYYALEEDGKKDPTHSNRNFDPIVAEEIFKEIKQKI